MAPPVVTPPWVNSTASSPVNAPPSINPIAQPTSLGFSPMITSAVGEVPYSPSGAPAFGTRAKARGLKRNHDEALPTHSLHSPPEIRPIAPLKIRRAQITPRTSPTLQPTSVPPSRDSSPAPDSASSPIKRARTSFSAEISNFSIFASSDDEMDECSPISSPSTRIRARFNQLLGPSPLQQSFSSPAVPQVSQMALRPRLAQPLLERAVTDSLIPPENQKIKTRARALLSKVEKIDVDDANVEMNKVYMLVHGRGMGMGSASVQRGYRRGSALRPKDEEERMDLD